MSSRPEPLLDSAVTEEVTQRHAPPVPADAADAGPRPARERRALAPLAPASVQGWVRGSIQVLYSVQAPKTVLTSAQLALQMPQVRRHRSETQSVQGWAQGSVWAPGLVLDLVPGKAAE